MTNKAVSRWENGESFPDIGVLESLSHLLELPIQDIVTGERAGDREEAVTEVVRLAKLQEQRKREKEAPVSDRAGAFDLSLCHRDLFIFRKRVVWGRDIACLVAGISMAGTLTMLGLVYRYFGKEEDVKMIPLQSIKQRTWNSIPCDAIVECWNHVFKLGNGSGRKCSPWYGTQLLGPFLNNQFVRAMPRM